MEIVVGWLIFSVAAAIFASKRGRSGFGWFLFSLFLSPLIAFVFLLVLGSKASVVVDRAAQEQAELATGLVMRCPYCRELVRRDAVKCKHCGSTIEEAVKTEVLSPPPSGAYKAGQAVGSLFSKEK